MSMSSLVDFKRPFPYYNDAPLSLATILEKDPPETDWVVTGLLAHKDRSLIYGEYGALKSWILIHLALHVAAGRPWLETFDIPKARSVLYVDEEMGQDRMHRRVRRLAAGAGIDQPHAFHSISHPGLRFDEAGAQRLTAYSTQHGISPELIFVEGLRRVIVGSENAAEDVARMWDNTKPLLRVGTGVVLSHHMRKLVAKGNNDSRYRASGSTDLQAGGDAALAISRQGRNAAIIEHIKSRDDAEAESFVIHFDFGPSSNSPVVLTFGGFQSKGGAQGGDFDLLTPEFMVQNFLLKQAQQQATTADLLRMLKEGADLPERSGERLLQQMVEDGIIERPRKGVYRRVEDGLLTPRASG